jgi:hypothetical protein
LYRTLLAIVRKVEKGELPIGLGGVDDTNVKGANGRIAADQLWQSLVPDHVTPGRPFGLQSAAE